MGSKTPYSDHKDVTLELVLKSICQQLGLLRSITTSKVIEWYVLVCHSGQCKCKGCSQHNGFETPLAKVGTVWESVANTWTSLCGYSYYLHWQSLGWLNTWSLARPRVGLWPLSTKESAKWNVARLMDHLASYSRYAENWWLGRSLACDKLTEAAFAVVWSQEIWRRV